MEWAYDDPPLYAVPPVDAVLGDDEPYVDEPGLAYDEALGEVYV